MSAFLWLGFEVTTFIGLTMINRILDGQMFTTTDTAFLHSLRLTQPYDLGFVTITGPNLSFLTSITNMADWEQYAVFGGFGQYFMVFMYGMSFVALFAIGITLLSMAVNAFRLR